MLNKVRAKIWASRVTKRNLGTKAPINCEQFIHKTDQATLAKLKKVPMFDKICSKTLSFVNEPQRRIFDMASKVRVSEKQLPKVFFMVKSICAKIGIEMPDIYLELDRKPNAYTYGAEKKTITIHSGLLECLDDDELYAVLAHECGHIACQHMLYHTMGGLLLEGGSIGVHKVIEKAISSTVVGGIAMSSIDATLQLAFYHWQRCSELSADRVAVVCCGGAEPVIKSMMRLAGGTRNIRAEINSELFIAQAHEYKSLMEENKVNKAMEFWMNCSSTHPLIAVRAYEAKVFAESEEFLETLKN